jgi:antitoxin YefM
LGWRSAIPTGKEEIACFIDTSHRAILVQVSRQVHKMRVVTFSEARNKLKVILDQVVNDADYTVITRRDADDAVVMSLEYFNSLLETVYLLKSPANVAHLERSITQYKQGQVIEQNLLDD